MTLDQLDDCEKHHYFLVDAPKKVPQEMAEWNAAGQKWSDLFGQVMSAQINVHPA